MSSFIPSRIPGPALTRRAARGEESDRVLALDLHAAVSAVGSRLAEALERLTKVGAREPKQQAARSSAIRALRQVGELDRYAVEGEFVHRSIQGLRSGLPPAGTSAIVRKSIIAPRTALSGRIDQKYFPRDDPLRVAAEEVNEAAKKLEIEVAQLLKRSQRLERDNPPY